MALVNLEILRNKILSDVKKQDRWNEISLSVNLKEKLGAILPSPTFLERVGMVKLGENIVLFPYQYFSLIVKIKDLIYGLKDYFLYYNDLIYILNNAVGLDNKKIAEILHNLIKDKVQNFFDLEQFCDKKGGIYNVFLSQLKDVVNKQEDQDFFVKFLAQKKFRGGKEIANLNEGKYVLRNIDDFYSSIALSVVNMPNFYSGYFGELAYILSKNVDTLNSLISEIEPKLSASNGKKQLILEDKLLRNFALKSFKYLLKKIDQSKLFEGKKEKPAKIDSRDYLAINLPDYFGTDNLIAVFNDPQDKNSLSSSKTQRFSEEEFGYQENKFSYFTTQWSDVSGGTLSFENLSKYINDVSSGKLLAEKNNGNYQLFDLKSSHTSPLNQILYGPPGTGKTYNTINHALAIINGKDVSDYLNEQKADPAIRQEHKDEFDSYVSEGRIQFVTFHQSYSYEEFIEGIKIKVNEDDQVYYEIEDGVFKKLCQTADEKLPDESIGNSINQFLEDLVEDGNELKLKTLSKNKDFTVSVRNNQTLIITPQTNKATELSINVKHLRDYILTGKIRFYPSYVKALKEHVDSNYPIRKATDNRGQNYVLIIDEINRGNISKIFGELITLIEDSKRIGRKEEIRIKLTYSGSQDGGKLFGVPDNLYIVGTMNTADKSIAQIDSALRRRFTFIEYTADPSYLSEDVEGINLRNLLETMNARIEYLLDRDHLLGHAYFIDVTSKNELCDVFRNKIIPLLEEYFYNDFKKIQLVFGDNDEWKKTDEFHLITVEKRNRKKDVFGADIDELEKQIFSINPYLVAGDYDRISAGVFKSIYIKEYEEKAVAETPDVKAAPALGIDEETNIPNS